MSKKAFLFSIYTCIILLLIMLPINSKESALNNTYVLSIRGDYLGHALIFLPWVWLNPINIGAQSTNKISGPMWLLMGIAFACLSEGIQYLLPYRSFNINDMLANSTGIVLSGLCYWLFTKQ